MFEDSRDRTLPERHVWQFLACITIALQGRSIRLSFPTNAVLQYRKTHVDLSGLAHAVGAVSNNIASTFGPGEVDQIQQTVLTAADVANPDTADGM